MDADQIEPADTTAAQQAETMWLLAQQVQLLTQRTVTLHANLLHAQRRASVAEAASASEPGTLPDPTGDSA